jgi:hypothetical protein
MRSKNEDLMVLKRARNAAGKTVKGTKWYLGALIWPFAGEHKKKKMLTFLASNALFTVMMPFAAVNTPTPTSEEFLKSQGLSTEIDDILAPGKTIHVVTNPMMNPHSLFRLPTLLWPDSSSYPPVTVVNPITAFFNMSAFNFKPADDTLPDQTLFNPTNECFVTMHNPEAYNAGRFIFNDDKIYSNELRNNPMWDNQLYAFMALHSMRHCADENKQLATGIEQEGDADYLAAKYIAEAWNTPNVNNWVFNWRAAQMPSASDHDDALYLQFKFNNVAPPSGADIRAANIEAGNFLSSKTGDVSTLSPLAQQRINIYNSARDFFMTKPG